MKKTSLHIGINYPNTPAELSGCVNDGLDWSEALRARGFDTKVMLDADATRDNMLAAMREVIDPAKSGDVVVITYSGHGTYVRDADGDEPDDADEALCPIDCFEGKLITDDELFDVFNDRARGVRLLFVSDSCHSGTVARFAAPTAPSIHAPKVRFLPPGNLMKYLGGVPGVRSATRSMSARGPSLKSSALLMSGCRDFEYSYDAWFSNRPNGAFTRAAIDALATLPERSTYRQWHAAVRLRLPTSQFPQVPLLTGTSSQKKWQAL